MEFTVNDSIYKCGRLSPRKEFHIARRMAPFLGALAPVISQAIKTKSAPDIDTILNTLPGFLEMFARMPDEDVDFCLYGLMAACTRKQSNGLGYAPVVVGENQLAFEDIRAPQMMQIAYQSFAQNIAPFFGDLHSDLSPDSQKQSGQ